MSIDAELDDLRREVERLRGILPERVDVDPEGVEHGLAKLVLVLVEFLRQLLERQAVRRERPQTAPDRHVLKMLRPEIGIKLLKRFENAADPRGIDRVVGSGDLHRSAHTQA